MGDVQKDEAQEVDFTSYRSGEIKTGGGQLLKVKFASDKEEQVKAGLAFIKKIEIPRTRMTTKPDGSDAYIRTRFEMIQHRYAGGGHLGNGGYVEVLEIKNPLKGHCGIVIFSHQSYQFDFRSVFFEFNNLKNALAAFDYHLGDLLGQNKKTEKITGFIRWVNCGIFNPWFFAVGDQLIEGDFTALDQIIETPEFRYGQKCLVFEDFYNFPVIKTCIGAKITERDVGLCGQKVKKYLTVYFDDGTAWNGYDSGTSRPRAVRENELWIIEAMDKIHNGMAGRLYDFEVQFRDGSKFVGKFKPSDEKAKNVAGTYAVHIIAHDGREAKTEIYFKPTPELPTIEAFLHDMAGAQDVELAEIRSIVKVKRSSTAKQKWSGVYPNPYEK